MFQWTGNSEAPAFDQELADRYVGQYVLVGVIHLDQEGQEQSRIQVHGVIQSASPAGITIALQGVGEGHTWVMPPALEAISLAEPGVYHLDQTGEYVENPDLIATWEVTEPPAT